jgi:protein-S-isoprenylcysteine O-methyltransferase Ste14
MSLPFLPKALTWALILANALFIALLMIHKPKEATAKSQSSRAVLIGVILQTLSYPAAWLGRRPAINPFRGKGGAWEGGWVEILIALLSILVAYASVLFFVSVKKYLGKHWALGARVVEGHELVTDGPYGRVRHPLYLAMFGLLAGAIVGVSSLVGAIVALAAFIPGTVLRARAEDKLLAATFGAKFEEYRSRVPAFIPKPR